MVCAEAALAGILFPGHYGVSAPVKRFERYRTIFGPCPFTPKDLSFEAHVVHENGPRC